MNRISENVMQTYWHSRTRMLKLMPCLSAGEHVAATAMLLVVPSAIVYSIVLRSDLIAYSRQIQRNKLVDLITRNHCRAFHHFNRIATEVRQLHKSSVGNSAYTIASCGQHLVSCQFEHSTQIRNVYILVKHKFLVSTNAIENTPCPNESGIVFVHGRIYGAPLGDIKFMSELISFSTWFNIASHINFVRQRQPFRMVPKINGINKN